MTLKICNIVFGLDIVSELNNVAADRTSLYQLSLPILPEDFFYSWVNLTNVVSLESYRNPLPLIEQSSAIQRLKTLKLTLVHETIISSPSELRYFVQIEHLSLLGFRLDELMTNIVSTTLPQLKSLEVNFKNDDSAKGLSLSTSLTSLDLAHSTEIKGDFLLHISHLTALQRLNICKCIYITNDHLQNLTRLTQLRILQADEICSGFWATSEKEIGPSQLFAVVGRMTQLRIANLNRNRNATDDQVAHLSNLTALRVLNLGFNLKLTMQGLSKLSTLTRLQALNINGCVFDHSFIPFITTHFISLRILKLEFTFTLKFEDRPKIHALLTSNARYQSPIEKIPSLFTLTLNFINAKMTSFQWDYDRTIRVLPKELKSKIEELSDVDLINHSD